MSAQPKKNCTNLKSRQLARLLTRIYDAELSKSGIKATQFSLLTHVAFRGPISASALARLMEIDTSTLSRNIKPLINAGWLAMNIGEDARSRIVVITSAGLQKQKEADVFWGVAQQRLCELLGEKRLASLTFILDECLAALQKCRE